MAGSRLGWGFIQVQEVEEQNRAIASGGDSVGESLRCGSFHAKVRRDTGGTGMKGIK